FPKDEKIIFGPIEEKDSIEKIVIEEMEKAYNMQVPLKVDYGWGKKLVRSTLIPCITTLIFPKFPTFF
ncbi:hypothetical protein EZS27_026825, partial [termite gut metagenome]